MVVLRYGLLLVCAGVALAQSSTQLVVRVGPEARLNINSVALRFAVPAPQPISVVVEAWARPLAGQKVRLVATPTGGIPLSALHWSGQKTAARGGGTAAACTSGAFGEPRALAENWTSPGTLTCTFTFTLEHPGQLAPGVYSGTVLLNLRLE